MGGDSKRGGQPLPGARRTHFLLHHTAGAAGGEAAGREGWACARAPLPLAALHRKVGATWPGCFPAGRMEDDEGPECGKPDFVLLDQVTMEDFMENLKLR